jgi:hypothetical protein
MYSTTAVGKLSESQKSKLRNGHPVRIKIGSGNTLNLTDPQIKKLQSAHKKGAAYTLTFHPEQAEKHGSGFFGDIASKAKAFARKHKDLINPLIGRVRAGVHGGIDTLSNKAKEKLEELASKANAKVDEFIQPIEGEGVKRRRGRPKKGEGIIGDALKGLIGMSGLGVVKPKRLTKGKGVIGDALKGLIGMSGLGVVKPKRLKKEGKGIMSSLLKAVAPAIIDAASNAAKGKVQGMGRKRKAGRPKGRGGGALFPAGNYGASD